MGKRSPEKGSTLEPILDHTADELRYLRAAYRWKQVVSLALDGIGVGNNRIPNGLFSDTTTIVDWLSAQPGLSTAPVRKVYRGIAKAAPTGKLAPELRALADEAVMVMLAAERRIDDAMRLRADPSEKLPQSAVVTAPAGKPLAGATKLVYEAIVATPDGIDRSGILSKYEGTNPLGESTVANALVVLFDRALVTKTKVGRNVYYRPAEPV